MNKTITLNDGNIIPTLGLGTWKSENSIVGEAVTYAITKAGYRHIDCAATYRNEEEVGEALHKAISSGSVKREDLFITSKLWNTEHHPDNVETACRKTLSDLKLDYLDLYLMHWGVAFVPADDPEPLDKSGKVRRQKVPILETWRVMESLVEKGLVKSIGVANFTAVLLNDLLAGAKIKPVINQIELHPYNAQYELVDFCMKEEVAVTAYTPLGNPSQVKENDPILLQDEVVRNIAQAHKKTPAQVLLNWAVSRGTIAIPKSKNPKRIDENIDIFDFTLSQKEQEQLHALNKHNRIVNPSEWWGIPYFD